MAEATLVPVECRLGRPEHGLKDLERATAALQASRLMPAAINSSVCLGAAHEIALARAAYGRLVTRLRQLCEPD